MNDDTFEAAPVSLSEARAKKEANASLWAPRDVLVQMLREIDSGEINPDAIVVVYRHLDQANKSKALTSYSISAPDLHVALGMISRAAYQMNEA